MRILSTKCELLTVHVLPLHLLEVLRDSLCLVVMPSYWIGSCQDGGASREVTHHSCLGNTDALLLLQEVIERG